MLTQLSTIKTRLGLTDIQVADDALLTNAIKAVSARFDLECRRTLGRTAEAIEEFDADETELRLGCYPLETVTRFDLKSNEAEGWVAQSGVEYLIRRGCVLSLAAPLGAASQQGRVVYTGGYVLPGTTAAAGQTPLPDDLEQAAVEQVVYWYQTRERVGVVRLWPKGGVYAQFADQDLMPSVRAALSKYERMLL
jgi:hypothetical protein